MSDEWQEIHRVGVEMVSSYCAPFCTNRTTTKATREKGIPIKGEKRSLWLNAIKRKSFLPGPNTYICSVHYVAGKILIITVILLLNFSLGKKRSDPQSNRDMNLEKRRQQKDKEERK